MSLDFFESSKVWFSAFTFFFLLHGGLLLALFWSDDSVPVETINSSAPFVVSLAPMVKTQKVKTNDSQAQNSSLSSNSSPKQVENEHQKKIEDKADLPEAPDAIIKKKSAQEKKVVEKSKELEEEKPKDEKEFEVTPEKSVASENQLEKEFAIDNAQLSDDAASPESGHEVILSAQVHRNWQAEIMAHLAKFKRYPRMSRLKKEEGIVMIRFVVDREGRVLESSLVENRRSNASAALKKEARNVIRRAAPLPVPPTEISGDAIELIVPIVFSLNRKIY